MKGKKTIALVAFGAMALACNAKAGDGEATSTGTGPDPNDPGALAKACSTTVNQPVRLTSQEARRQVIYVTSVSECDVPPQSHVLHLKLENKGSRNGTYEVVEGFPGTSDFAWRECRAIPIPSSRVKCEWAVPCAAGYWRAYALVTGTGPNGREYTYSTLEEQKPTDFKVDECWNG